jgi:hypothetical protein
MDYSMLARAFHEPPFTDASGRANSCNGARSRADRVEAHVEMEMVGVELVVVRAQCRREQVARLVADFFKKGALAGSLAELVFHHHTRAVGETEARNVDGVARRMLAPAAFTCAVHAPA